MRLSYYLGACMLQMRTAPGARLCLRGQDLEISARVPLLLEHGHALPAALEAEYGVLCPN